MIISDSLAQEILNAVLGNAALTPSANLYFGLVTSAPSANGSGYTEVAGGSYARVNKTNNQTNFPAVTGISRTGSNGTDITFPTASAAWGSVVGVCVFYASTGGNARLYAPLTEPRSVLINDVVSFTSGQLQFSIPV